MKVIETLGRMFAKQQPQAVEAARYFPPKLPAPETDPDAFDRYLILSAEKHLYDHKSVLSRSDLSPDVLAWARKYYPREHDLVASRLHEIRLGWAVRHHTEMLADRLSWQQALQNQDEWTKYVPTKEWQERVRKANKRTIHDFLEQPNGREEFAQYMLDYEESTGILAENIFSAVETLELYRLMFDRVVSSNRHLKQELTDDQFRAEEDHLNAAVTAISQTARNRRASQLAEKR
jgi:hypothetical protein